MNDEELPGLSAAAEARIRALLAEAKHDEPMPGAVVARLDRVLAGLADEATEIALPASVTPLAERRRRAARLLVAAAVIVVAGVGIGQVVSDGGGAGTTTSGDRAGAGSDSNLLPRPTAEGSSADSAGGGAELSGDLPQAANGAALGAPLRVRPHHFARDSRFVRAQAMETADTDTRSSALRGYDDFCAAGSWGAGRYVPVEYGRAPGYLVLRRASGDSQVADLFLCDGTEPVRSITLPGP